MSLISIPSGDPLVNFEALRALVVDDFPGMRTALKMTLSNFGLTRIDLCASSNEALFRVQNNQYDLILCDFNLGEGRDGQQLLEELRHRSLIRLRTVFMMATAESIYEKVVATAELAPDDYLIKPFSAELMRNRLGGILRRKQAFSLAYECFEEHDLEGAIESCDALIRDTPRYAVDALRFKGECLNALGRFEEAEALYRQVIEMRAIPWARMGLAMALHQQQKDAEAESLLQDALTQSPEMVAAYDLLADVRMARKDAAGAQAALLAGVGISARTVRRQQRLGEVALDNGDLAAAQTAFSNAIEKGRHSVFITPQDYGQLGRVQVAQGNLEGAMETLRKGGLALQSNPDGKLVAALVQCLVQTRAGRAAEAGRSLDEVARLRAGGAQMAAPLLLELAGACLSNGRHEEADGLLTEVARNAHDSDALLTKARSLYEQAGRAEAGEKLLSAATSNVRALNNDGVLLARKGEYAAAAERMLEACRLASANPRVLMNGVWVLLKCVEQAGPDQDKLDQARQLLAAVETQSPRHPRVAGLRACLREIELRNGARRRGTR
ncbi:MAG: response regulator [Betaproteobacteria bacterium]|nr:response regulator [Betaproteobacteria bacterium]